MRYFDTVSWCSFQTYRSNIRTANIQMLIWRHIYFALASLIAQCTFKIVDVCQQRFVLTKLPSLWFIFDLPLLHFDLLISSDSLIFLLLYLASRDNVFGCSQLNWSCHFKQCLVAPEFSHFPYMLSCWCSIGISKNNNKCTDKTKLKHSTSYCNGSIKRFSFTIIQTIYWKASPEWNRFFNFHREWT